MAFKRDSAYEDQTKYVLWIMWTIIAAFAALYVLMLLMIPLRHLLNNELSILTWQHVIDFWKRNWDDTTKLIVGYSTEIKRFSNMQQPRATDYLIFVPFIAFFLIFIGGLIRNPYEYMPKIFGGGRMAEYGDIKKMKLFDGFCIVLGRFKGKLMKMPETLSCLVVAPPGTGKTVGVVIPTILESPTLSLIVNDPKPELCYNTTAYRATIGPVFVINWGAQDEPEKGIFYPSWNPLSASCLPPLGSDREKYLDSMVAVLVEEPKGGADPH